MTDLLLTAGPTKTQFSILARSPRTCMRVHANALRLYMCARALAMRDRCSVH